MATIKFGDGSGASEQVDGAIGETIFAIAQRAGVSVETACVGKGTCGLCRIVIRSGEDFLSEPGEIDEKHLGNVYWLTKIRLACQSVITADGEIVVDVQLKKKS